MTNCHLVGCPFTLPTRKIGIYRAFQRAIISTHKKEKDALIVRITFGFLGLVRIYSNKELDRKLAE